MLKHSLKLWSVASCLAVTLPPFPPHLDRKVSSYTAQVTWIWYDTYCKRVNVICLSRTNLHVCRHVNCQHFTLLTGLLKQNWTLVHKPSSYSQANVYICKIRFCASRKHPFLLVLLRVYTSMHAFAEKTVICHMKTSKTCKRQIIIWELAERYGGRGEG